MANGLPENFTERWIKVEVNVENMAKKLDKIEPTDIDHLKKDMSRIKGVGATIFTGFVVGLGMLWAKIAGKGG